MANIIRRIISTASAPTPVGPYSQAVLAGNTLYLSGQIALDPASGQMVSGGVEAEADQVLRNMQAVLEAAGTNFSNVVKTTVLLANMEDFAAVNGVYAKYFSGRVPARVAYQAAALPKGALVEIEAIAVVGTITDVE